MTDPGYGGRTTRLIRWIARGWTIAGIGVVVLFCVGEGLTMSTAAEWAGFLFFPVGTSVGMVVAWRREGAGGAITVGSLLAFYVVHYATSGALPRGWAWLAFAAPGLLFLLLWSRSRSGGTS